MSTFVIAYSVFWLALAIYVVQMGGKQRKLKNRMEMLEKMLQRESS